MFCTFGNHRANGLVEKTCTNCKNQIVSHGRRYTKMYITKRRIKNYLELTILCQSKIKRSPFKIHFDKKLKTIWKQLASGKPSVGILDKGKSILSKERAKDWNAVDRVEDGYKDTLIPQKNQQRRVTTRITPPPRKLPLLE